MNRRSPLSQSPLRTPGQSVEQYRIEKAIDLFAPATTAVSLTILWLLDLWRSYRDFPPSPWLTGTFATAAIVYAVWRFRKTAPVLRRLRLARDGELLVGQGLEQLRAAGYAVYHDLIGDDFNIDHILVGPAGVFTVETKTWRKPAHGNPAITVNGESILIDGQPPIRDPAPQARAQARWVEEVLTRSTGRAVAVHPVVVFPGWWVEIKKKPHNFWLLNDKMLPGFLGKEPSRLSKEQIAMISFHLEAFIRSQALRTETV